MAITVSLLSIALLAASGEVDTVIPSSPIALTLARTGQLAPPPAGTPGPERPGPTVVNPQWQLEPKRPAALAPMYVSFAALQGLDVYSSQKAVAAGARETNPLLGQAIDNTAAMVAVKAATTAATIYFAERAWKKNRKGAMILMAAVNGVAAAVVAANLANASK